MLKPEEIYVFQSSHDELWYFWSETRLRTLGGYTCKEEAQLLAHEYFKELDRED